MKRANQSLYFYLRMNKIHVLLINGIFELVSVVGLPWCNSLAFEEKLS